MNSTAFKRTSTSRNNTASSEQIPTSQECSAGTFLHAGPDLGIHGTPVRAKSKFPHQRGRSAGKAVERLTRLGQQVRDLLGIRNGRGFYGLDVPVLSGFGEVQY
ncbi:hypothetical protein ACFXDJ_31425 [Streptomyces sp. NPDC059443]|uniref:hypothetical protein n=1 Tax=unclassified Streptomyces TaxID=2593676 RepID=UPI00368A93AC